MAVVKLQSKIEQRGTVFAAAAKAVNMTANPSSPIRICLVQFDHGTWTDVLGCGSPAAALTANFHAVRAVH
jgi:hypothetical protein